MIREEIGPDITWSNFQDSMSRKGNNLGGSLRFEWERVHGSADYLHDLQSNFIFSYPELYQKAIKNHHPRCSKLVFW